MSSELMWRLHVRAKREDNARRVLRRLIAVLDLPAEEKSVERYWKIPEQYVLEFTTPIEAATPAEAVFQAILAAMRIGSGWSVSLQDYADGGCELGMLCAGQPHGHFSVAGAEWGVVNLRIEGGSQPGPRPSAPVPQGRQA
jgi:hypothetical protein